MKWTPQKTMTSASVLRRLLRQREAVADDVRDITGSRSSW